MSKALEVVTIAIFSLAALSLIIDIANVIVVSRPAFSAQSYSKIKWLSRLMHKTLQRN